MFHSQTVGQRCVRQLPFVPNCSITRPSHCTTFRWYQDVEGLAFMAHICRVGKYHNEGMRGNAMICGSNFQILTYQESAK